jgi:hypothetical protein
LCECCRCEKASDQSGDQFVHFENPQLELINQMTRLCLSHVGKRAIHLSVDMRIEQIFRRVCLALRLPALHRESGLHKGP